MKRGRPKSATCEISCSTILGLQDAFNALAHGGVVLHHFPILSQLPMYISVHIYIYIHNFYFFRYILRLPCTYLDVYMRVYHVKIYGHNYLSALMYRYSYTYHILMLYVNLPNCFGLASSTLGKLFTLFQCIIFRLGLASLPT